MSSKKIYRIVFVQFDNIYEIYARKLYESDIFGFLEIEEFVFGENSSIVVDPSEEKLKQEFSSVQKSYIPLGSVIRIDEVSQRGTAKLHDKKSGQTNVNVFPMPPKHNK